MLSLLKKYKQWLACFLAGLLCVVFSSVVFAQETLVSNAPSANVTNAQEQNEYQINYGSVANDHSEPNFYGNSVEIL